MPLAARQHLSDFGFIQLSGETLTLTGTTNFLGTLKSKGIEINASPSASGYTSGGTGATVYVLTLLGNSIRLAPSTGGGGGTNVTFNTNRATTRSGIPIVNVGGACTVTNFLEGYFFPAVPPSSSLSIALGGASRQFGDQCCNNCPTGLAWSVTKNTNSFCNGICLDNCGLGVGVYNCCITATGINQSGAIPYCICGVCAIPASTATTSTSQSFKMCAITIPSEVTQANASITWQNKRFWFKSSTPYAAGDAGTIQALLNAGSVLGSELSTTRVKSFSPIAFSGEYFYYVYPVNEGIPSFTVNGLPNNAWGNLGTGTLFPISYTNTNGYGSQFYVAKSDQSLNATFTISVA